MKKLLSVLLAAAMIMSFIVIPTSAAEAHTHCWCENAETIPENHTCDESIEWTAIAQSGTTYTVPGSGYYYLNWTGATAKKIVINSPYKVFLCLNGASIRAQTCINLVDGAELTICDCSESMSGVITTTKITPVPVVAGSTVNFMSGNINGTYGSTAKATSVTVTTDGAFNMYGGTITNGYTTASGGNVAVSGGAFNMYGGTITNGQASEDGGNVAVSGGAFNMHSGTITNGQATADGGNVAVSGGAFDMYGGTITKGQATVSGGNITVSDGAFNLHDGTITEGFAGAYGGNISVISSGALNIYGGSVTSGESTTHGGNISALSGTVDVEGGTISGGVSGKQGGNIAAAGGTVTVKDGAEISGGKATTFGGNISVNNKGDLVVEGGSITGGKSTTYGGNIAINDADSTISITGGDITGGEASTYGGNIGVTTGKLTISGGDITGGESTTYGGNVGVNGGTVTISGTKTAEATEVEGETVTTYSTNITGGQSTTKYGGNIGVLSGTVNFQGGKIADGHAKTHGGNIGMGNGSFNMTGGDVYGGLAEDSGNGMSVRNNAKVSVTGGAFVDTGINATGGSASVTLGGDARIFNVYLGTGKTIALDAENPFTGHAGVTMYQPGDFLATETDYSANFSSADSNYYAAFTGTAMTLKAYAIKIGSTGYKTLQEAINAADSEDYIRLLDNVTEDVQIDKRVFIDLNGKVLTSHITGTGTLCGMDRSGDEYVTPTGRITGTVECTVADHVRGVVGGKAKRYAAIKDENGYYTFHRYYMGITHMSLKPGVAGVGYKAYFYADDEVKALLSQEDAFGYILQVEGNDPVTCALDLDKFESGKAVTLRLHNVDVANYGETPVIGKVFMNFGGNVIESFSYSYSMKDMVEAAAKNIADFTVAQLSALKDLCEANSEAMADWEIDNIRNWEKPEVTE